VCPFRFFLDHRHEQHCPLSPDCIEHNLPKVTNDAHARARFPAEAEGLPRRSRRPVKQLIIRYHSLEPTTPNAFCAVAATIYVAACPCGRSKDGGRFRVERRSDTIACTWNAMTATHTLSRQTLAGFRW
jgi:hypothetical protein